MAAGDVKRVLGADAAFTFTSITSLASSATRTAGAESTARTPADPVVDEIVEGKVTTGTTPTANKQIDVWVYASFQATPAYPDVLDGTDSAETITSENVRNSALVLAASIQVDSTSDRTYWVAPFSVAALFGGMLPKAYGLFVAHDTGAALNGTAANHAFRATPVYHNVAQS